MNSSAPGAAVAADRVITGAPAAALVPMVAFIRTTPPHRP
jgi:hypothetical protein